MLQKQVWCSIGLGAHINYLQQLFMHYTEYANAGTHNSQELSVQSFYIKICASFLFVFDMLKT
jgi:hypothetical protein